MCETVPVIVRETLGTLAASRSPPPGSTHLATIRPAVCETVPVMVPDTRRATLRVLLRATVCAMVRETGGATMYATLRVIAWETRLLAAHAALRVTLHETWRVIVRETWRATGRVTLHTTVRVTLRQRARATRESPRSGDCWRLCAKVRSLPPHAARCCGGCGSMRSAIRNTKSYFGRSRRYLTAMLSSCARHWGCGSRARAFLISISHHFSMRRLQMTPRLLESCENLIPVNIWLIREAAGAAKP